MELKLEENSSKFEFAVKSGIKVGAKSITFGAYQEQAKINYFNATIPVDCIHNEEWIQQ